MPDRPMTLAEANELYFQRQEAEGKAQQRAELGRQFQPDPRMETALARRESDPEFAATWDELYGPSADYATRVAQARYVAGRAAAIEFGTFDPKTGTMKETPR